MKVLKLLKILFVSIFLSSACTAVKEKADSILDKENQKLSKFINKSEENLRIALGEPDFQTTSDGGYHLLFYRNKKFGISCERRFEIDESGTVIGFISKGCFWSNLRR